MTGKVRAAQILLRAYPANWREMYGEELATILEGRPFTLPIVLDVLRNGLLQRIQCAETWQNGGIILAVWLIAGTTLNSIRPFSQWGYNLFWQLQLWMLLVIGYFSVSRDGKNRLGAMVEAGKAALVGITPEMVLCALWIAGFVHPTILQSNGAPMVVGHGITDLCIRAGYAVRPADMLLAPLVTAIPGMIIGSVGASIAQFVLAFREGLCTGKE